MCQSFSSWYQHRIAPYTVHFGCSSKVFSRVRELVVSHAEGVVVEVGFGSGLNLPYYDPVKVKHLIGVDPDTTMLNLAKRQNTHVPFPVDYIPGRGEDLPIGDASADTVVVSYALCTIPAPEAALAEIRRILKPRGRLIFTEHGRMASGWRARLQDRMNRLWSSLAGGCNLNRNPLQLLVGAGFDIQETRQERFPFTFWLLGNHFSGFATLGKRASPGGC